jgi:hypothetical protein
MPSPRNIKGLRSGKLVAYKYAGYSKGGCRVWECDCDCGGKKYCRSSDITYQSVQSCGCLCQYTLKEAQNIFSKYGHLLLTTEYAGVKIPMKYCCGGCGQISNMSLDSVMQGQQCWQCGIEKRASIRRRKYSFMGKELTLAQIKILTKSSISLKKAHQHVHRDGCSIEEAFIFEDRREKIIEAFGEKKSILEWSKDSRCVVEYATLVHRFRLGIRTEMAITTAEYLQIVPEWVESNNKWVWMIFGLD